MKTILWTMLFALPLAAPSASKPIVSLQAPPTGQSLVWGADRKQFGDLVSDFSAVCSVSVVGSDPRGTQPDLSQLGLTSQKKADFLVVMSRFDTSFKRHTRIRVFDQTGAVISDKESLNMKDQAKVACGAIMEHWSHAAAQ